MLHANSDTLNVLNKRVASSSATIHQEATKTIVQAVCSGRPIVGVIGEASAATIAVIEAALADLAFRKTRIFRVCETMVSCLGPASAMDHLRVSEMKVNDGKHDRSKQVIQSLQLLGRPVPGETRRLLVIEGAESVDPELLDNLARMPGLDAATLPLQLLYVGSSSYWDSLIASKEGAARQRIGAPMILLQALPGTKLPDPSSLEVERVIPVVVTQMAPKKVQRSKWLLAGLVVLGCGGLVAAGLVNRDFVFALFEADASRLVKDAEASAKVAGEGGHPDNVLKMGASRSVSSENETPVTSGERTDTQSSATASVTTHDVVSAKTVNSDAPALPDADHGLLRQTAAPHPELPAPTLETVAASRIISASISRGDAMLALHDLSAARRYYELAANAGSADAALALGRTYDPTSLVRSGSVSAQSNGVLAAEWYRKAASLGSTEAGASLRNLGRQQSN